MNINENLLSPRDLTDVIVIHHTGADLDASAEQINEWHINQGWVCIGYHYVIRKNGEIEKGRPEWAIGSHTYGENYHSIGIHLSGEFDSTYPTSNQIESCAELIADICLRYDIPIDSEHIKGHRDFMATDCPGENLYNQLDTIIGKANWYANPPEQELESKQDSGDIFYLSEKYESSGDPASVSSGIGDLGGKSYGLYQFASNLGVVDDFVDWLTNYPDDLLANYGRVLSEHTVNSEEFIRIWKELGSIDPGNFGRLQNEYVKEKYYNIAEKKLKNKNFTLSDHSNKMKAVAFSRAIQNGTSGCVELFEIACSRMGHPNLSYVDDAYFDNDIISNIYDFLIEECDNVVYDNSIYHSPNGFCNGSENVINGLRNRFIHEKQDALES